MTEWTPLQTLALGLRVQYYQSGNSGSSVILLHGGGTDSATLSWRLLIPELAAGHRVFAPDWPGYGGSQIFEAGYSFERMTDWLHALVEQWDLEKVSLVGISMGGGGALSYAFRHPERVDRLVLADSYGLQRKAPYHRLSYWMVRMPWLMRWTWGMVRGSRSMARWSLASIFADRRNISEALTDEVFAAVQNPSGQNAFSEFQRSELLPDRLLTCYMDRLGEIERPVLIVHGRQDGLVPLADAQEAARRIRGARLEVIDGAGHWPMRERPDVFNPLVAGFLKDKTPVDGTE